MVSGGWGVIDGTLEEVQGMDDVVALGHFGLGEVVVEELNGAREQQGLGHPIHHMEIAVVVEGQGQC